MNYKAKVVKTKIQTHKDGQKQKKGKESNNLAHDNSF